MQRLRIGLIGTGYWARDIHARSAATHPRLELAGVWGRDAAKAAEVANELGTRAYADLDALIDNVDVLTFAVPPDVQADVATRAAQRGRHLLLEKPVATSRAAAQRLERAITDAGVASIVFFTRRFVPATADWLEQQAAVGGWECGRADFAANIFVPDGPFAASAWRREKGALWDIGPHALSLLWPLLGNVTSVIAGRGVRDQVHLVLTHQGGASSTVSLSLTVPAGSTGTVVYVYGAAGREIAPLEPLPPTDVVAAHQRALDALLAQVDHSGAGHPCDVRFGARVVEVLAAAEDSLRTAQRTDVPSAT